MIASGAGCTSQDSWRSAPVAANCGELRVNLRIDAEINVDAAENMRHYLRRICGK